MISTTIRQRVGAVLGWASLLLTLAGCDGWNGPLPPATVTLPTLGAPTASPLTAPAPAASNPAQPDYTPVTFAGSIPYVPPEPWLVAPTAPPGQATATPYGGSLLPGRNSGNNKKPSPTPERPTTATPRP